MHRCMRACKHLATIARRPYSVGKRVNSTIQMIPCIYVYEIVLRSSPAMVLALRYRYSLAIIVGLVDMPSTSHGKHIPLLTRNSCFLTSTWTHTKIVECSIVWKWHWCSRRDGAKTDSERATKWYACADRVEEKN